MMLVFAEMPQCLHVVAGLSLSQNLFSAVVDAAESLTFVLHCQPGAELRSLYRATKCCLLSGTASAVLYKYPTTCASFRFCTERDLARAMLNNSVILVVSFSYCLVVSLNILFSISILKPKCFKIGCGTNTDLDGWNINPNAPNS